MQLMQYEITLPRDYDMGIIRHRVATRGSGTDRFPGLGIKAYLVRERGREGSPVNQYSPFYVWADVSGMNEFLFGPGFGGIQDDFGRPAVRTWNGIALSDGPERHTVPTAATLTVHGIDGGLSLSYVRDRLTEETIADASRPGVTCTVAGVDPSTWRGVHLTLWAERAPEAAGGQRFDVLHLSQPQRVALPRVGR